MLTQSKTNLSNFFKTGQFMDCPVFGTPSPPPAAPTPDTAAAAEDKDTESRMARFSLLLKRPKKFKYENILMIMMIKIVIRN